MSDLREQIEREGVRLARPAKQQAAVAISASRWAIVREIVNPADLSIIVEFARRGRNYGNAEIPEDYGRYVGEHEYYRTGNPPPYPPIGDYLHEVSLLPHTVADDYRYFLCPPIEDDPSDLYRDTHVDDTDIIPLWRIAGDWVAIPIYRDWNETVDSAARRHDCIVEG
jgi:hypothetical protein